MLKACCSPVWFHSRHTKWRESCLYFHRIEFLEITFLVHYLLSFISQVVFLRRWKWLLIGQSSYGRYGFLYQAVHLWRQCHPSSWREGSGSCLLCLAARGPSAQSNTYSIILLTWTILPFFHVFTLPLKHMNVKKLYISWNQHVEINEALL